MISIAKFFEPSPTVERGAFIIAVVTAFGSALGIVKNTLLGAQFGAGAELDLYFAAFRIPDFLYNIFIFSTLSSSFLPIFSRLIIQGKEKLWGVLSSLILIFTVVLGICGLVVLVFSHEIVGILAPGFSSVNADRLSLFLRVLMIQPILLAVSNLIAMTLQGFKRFFISSCAPIFYNAGIIIGILVFSQWWGMMGVIFGVICGALFHLLIQLPSLWKLGFSFRPAIQGSLPHLKEMFLLMIPRSFALVANSFLSLWVVMVSSLLIPGSLSVFDLANSIQALPQTIFALSFITASFPFLSSAWAAGESQDGQGEKKDFIRLAEQTMHHIIMVMIPVAMVLAVFAPVVVRMMLGYGNFSVDDQSQTSLALVMFCIGIPFQALLMFLVRGFFAMKNTKIPLYSVLITSALMIPGIWLSGVRFGVWGIALVMSCGAILNTIYLFFIFKRILGGVAFPMVREGMKKGFVLGSFAAFPGGVVYYVIHAMLKGATSWIFIFELTVAALVSCVSVFVALYVIKVVDLRELFKKQGLNDLENGSEPH